MFDKSNVSDFILPSTSFAQQKMMYYKAVELIILSNFAKLILSANFSSKRKETASKISLSLWSSVHWIACKTILFFF